MIEPGYCMICHGVTHTSCGSCGVKKFTDQHTEVEMRWSNGSKMKVGVCVHCAMKNAHLEAVNKKKITDAHHNHWSEIRATFDPEVTIV